MSMTAPATVTDQIRERFPDLTVQETADGIPTVWADKSAHHEVLRYLKEGIERPYRMMYDLTAIDERMRRNRAGQPPSDFTVVYTLLSFDRNDYVRVKVALEGETPSLESITGIWQNANWYEREAWDMFGIRFAGHPLLQRILMPRTWVGHPLRKEHPSRATEMGQFRLPDEKEDREQEALRFRPEEWGMARSHGDTEFMFMNIGPQHPGTHGVLRIIVQLDGETIVDLVPDIGYHHRAQEKVAERQTWHTYIPYTDRVDYLAGVINELAYLTAVEKLAGIEVPPRAKVIRVMMSELFRIMSHLVWYGTFAQDVGQLSPVFFMFNDRERGYKIIEGVTGYRMHPGWFRIGGTAADLPHGWEAAFREFLDHMHKALAEYDRTVMRNRIFKGRTMGVGEFNTEQAIAWGVTGPNLRATGLAWDVRKAMPYSGYEQFEFDIPISNRGDCYGRAEVRVEEMRQSMRIIEQCMRNMPEGPYKSAHRLATPPLKERTMHDIETLITHFLNVSWGPVMPAGEVLAAVENTKGNNGYYLVSDGSTSS
ncbi:MAG TPA: NADH-quinone oxidoreductase subunit C/D, partial [Bryobacteraceae bacterium]|nr:NADH-quinone oxidoreductase subunit C/D [Bryobacteraceae bacterium]